MAETVSYTVPQEAVPGFSTAKVRLITIDALPPFMIKILLHEWEAGTGFIPNGRTHVVSYSGPEAAPILQAINSGSFLPKTLRTYLLDRLVADGKLPGVTIT